MKKRSAKVLLVIFLIPVVLVIFSLFNEGAVIFVANQVLFPIHKKYLFTYNGVSSCENNQDPRVIKICGTIDEIKKNKLSKENARSLEQLGLFKNNFIKFINGNKKIRFYYSEDLAGSRFTKSVEEKGLFSVRDRIKFFLLSKSPEQDVAAYSIPFFNRITIGPNFLKYDLIGSRAFIAHEIFHLCWATEEEARFLTMKLNTTYY